MGFSFHWEGVVGQGVLVPQAARQLCSSVCCDPPASQHSSSVLQQRQVPDPAKVELNPLWNFSPPDFILGKLFQFLLHRQTLPWRSLVLQRSVDKQLSGSPGNRVLLVSATEKLAGIRRRPESTAVRFPPPEQEEMAAILTYILLAVLGWGFLPPCVCPH